jgi:hypothetical protein
VSLYDLSTEMRAVMAELEELAGELTPELEARLDAIEGDIRKRIDATCAAVLELDALAAAAKAEADRMMRLASRRGAAANRLRAHTLRCMELAQLRRVDGSRFTVTTRANPPRVVVDALPTALPACFIRERVSLSPDKQAIAAALRAGEDLRGIAHTETSSRLEIR